MSRPRKRAFLSIATAAGLVAGLLLPGVASGAAARKFTDHFVELFCDGVQGDDGTLFFGITVSAADGAFAGLEAWGPGAEPFVDPPAFIDDLDRDATGSASTTALSVDIPVIDTNGDPAGSAHVRATLAIGGEAQVIDRSFKNGNSQTRETGTFQPLAITRGTATLPDGSSFTFGSDSDQCAADETRTAFWANSPTSLIQTFAANQVDCDLMSGDEVVGNLFVDVDPDGTSAFVDVFFPDAGTGGSTRAPIVGGRLASDIEFHDLDSGDPVGNGSIDATFASTSQEFQYTLRDGTSKARVMGVAFAVAGSLVAPGFPAFDLGGCYLADLTVKAIDSPVRAPRPTGKAPANDVPAGAIPVRTKSMLTEQTKNAAFDMEVPFACLTTRGEGGVREPLPVIKTVWFKLVGSGSPVTLDTAGTNFDTVLAVYTKSGSSYVPVARACNDDVRLQPVGSTRQAAVRFTPAAGVTYYVQVGGFYTLPNWGTLHLAMK